MAWRSSGSTNDEMVTNLKNNGVIHTQAVELGFRGVDRRFFVPRNRQDIAHSDQPLKEGNVHISAPHIYGAVVEALELPPEAPLSFLNIGSGTGYLTCIAAQILGPTSTHYGVEIHEDVVEHCRQAMQAWKDNRDPSAPPVPQIEILHGNGLQIDTHKGESHIGVDRIYIGAAVEKSNLGQLAGLLKPGGILVGPVGDELVKIVRIGDANSTPSPPPPRSFRGQPPALPGGFSQQVISGVRFAPLVESPSLPVILPSRVWSPSVHSYYPESFRKACKEIMLCSRAPTYQAPPIEPRNTYNMAGALPRAIWMEILSYTRRDWFEQPRSDEDFLRKRLREEQAAVQRAQDARMEAEARLHMVERERDIYRLLALRWQRRLQSALNERGRNDATGAMADDDVFAGIDDVAAAAVFAGDEPLVIRLGGLGAMIRRFQHDSDDDEDDDESVAEDNQGQEEMDDESQMSEDGETMEATTEAEPMAVSPGSESTMDNIRPQIRTVSITAEDL